MTQSLEELGNEIAAALPGAVLGQTVAIDQLTLDIAAGDIVRTVRFLRDDPAYAFVVLIDMCGVDWPQRARRFDVVYHLLSLTQNRRVRLKVQTDEESFVPSIVSVYPAANWFERETFDMYGITFADHPDMRRLLTDYGFSGYPLRKDFPLTGFVETIYDEEVKRVVYRPVELIQEFREFDFMSPWEGAQYVLPGDEKTPKGSG
ncbi:MAG: NADH-quinone oxidoreductase subunit C [Rhizomicrobium sp.]|jgi:NADH-quinone oxidoreductase subunit C